jgi:hypothetical protein
VSWKYSCRLPSCRDIVLDHDVIMPLISQRREDMRIPVKNRMCGFSVIIFSETIVCVSVDAGSDHTP